MRTSLRRASEAACRGLAARLYPPPDAHVQQLVTEALDQGEDFAVLALRIERMGTLMEAFGPDVTCAVERRSLDRLGPMVLDGAAVVQSVDGEILMVVPGLDGLSGQRYMERLLTRLTRAIEMTGLTIAPRVIIGAAYSPAHGDEALTLIRRARIARSSAREHFLPVACYESGRDEVWTRHLSLIADMRLAFERDELHLNFQPKVCARTGCVNGAEALIRWHHPTRGWVAPDDFIPLAETSGIIVDLGDHVLRLAIAQLARWQAAGTDLSLAVNLCARDIEDPSLLERVSRYLKEADVPAERLMIEVTENAVMHDATLACEVLRQLRAGGIRVSLDDFGTGQSSLSKLRDIPVDELKIDGSFVSGIREGTLEALIVGAVVELGHAAGCSVVAEGVETESERALIASLGTDLIQGWLFARAMPADEFDRWLIERDGLFERHAA